MKDRQLKHGLVFGLVFLAAALLASAADVPCVWTGIAKITAIGDLHGDYDNFVQILKGTHLVDGDLHWAAGNIHLVQTGDIMDRGTQARQILDLLMRLEKEAPETGGMVHVLLGNHEEMNITGISLDYPTYVTVEQFVSFLPEEFRKAREAAYISRLRGDEKTLAMAQGLDLSSDAVRAYWTDLMRNNAAARRAYVAGFNETYGKWLAEKNAVIKIDDIVFCHGGISEKYSTWSLHEINSTLRRELRLFQGYGSRDPREFPRAFRPEMVYAQDSPLWYRGLALMDEKSSVKEIDRILANLKARVMVVGHTRYESGGSSPVIPDLNNLSRFHGKVYIIDTGISSVYGGILSALVIEGETITLWEPRGEVITQAPAPASPERRAPLSPQESETYLKTAAVLAVQKESVSGRTAPWKIKLESDGNIRQALFKYINRPRPDPIPDSYKYELAAYKLNSYLGLEFVPPVVEREIEGIPGSLQVFVENAVSMERVKGKNLHPPEAKAFAGDMDDLKVFENLVRDSCTNDRDTLIQQPDWRLFRVDFSEAFAPDNETVPGCEIVRCSRKLYGALDGWAEAEVARLLSPYLNADEIRALNARRNLIVRSIKDRIRSKGEGAVLF